MPTINSNNHDQDAAQVTTQRKIVPYTPRWDRLANSLARDFAPPIYPCPDCCMPVMQGYCCTYCGSRK
jgi:hypothetical protein